MPVPLRRISALDQADWRCVVCLGEGWVCEDHPQQPWKEGDGCCGAAGKPCECNPLSRDVPAPTFMLEAATVEA